MKTARRITKLETYITTLAMGWRAGGEQRVLVVSHLLTVALGIAGLALVGLHLLVRP